MIEKILFRVTCNLVIILDTIDYKIRTKLDQIQEQISYESWNWFYTTQLQYRHRQNCTRDQEKKFR